jgi:MFS family permease
MVLVMTAVPLHLHHHGHGIGLVGAVLSAHTLGMFVLSPLTGRILDVVGTRRVMLGGLALLVAGAAVTALTGRASVLAPALFALGIGWNLCFVGGSAVLARDVPEPDRATVEGAVETGVWWLAAVGSMAATVLLAVGGLPVLAAVAIVVAVLPVAAVLSPGTAGESGDPEARPVPAGTRP